MRYKAALHLLAVAATLLITWRISINCFDVREKASNILGLNYIDRIRAKFQTAKTPAEPKCGSSIVCPADRFALDITSGAPDAVGPKICFEGKTIMSHVLNNVGPGLNTVVINGETGVVEKFGYLNTQSGIPEDILAYFQEIKPGMIVLVASFDDVTPKLTDEVREVLVGMGSTLIKSVKARDSWVFAGRAGMGYKSLYEKLAVNDEKTNIYEGWPEFVEVGGCFPKAFGRN